MSEKIGSAKGSKLEDDFIELERVRNYIKVFPYVLVAYGDLLI
jgi:hypothetical protein